MMILAYTSGSQEGAMKQKTCECQNCGYIWEPRKPNPKCCPKCISRYWAQPHKVVRETRKVPA